ncbi:MAG: hypothetical protein QHD01_02850 [Bradyrhizobium sp.]|uniref:hypothetical protein n=1 Tax=Bradyrhizobium sp. TaxID=376 RepID=UPI0029BF24B4|nr:hypothetical protein [Bradyrhizobium sp.]MDX3965523.1 hypothetical protein [Bradyrhizobium sp.]
MKSLQAALEAKVPWHRIAEILKERLAGRERAEAAAVLVQAEASTHLKPLVLKRILAIAERLDRMSRREGIPAVELALPSYNALELALRLYDRDRAAGLRALEELRAGRTTIAELQRRVSSLPPGSADPAAAARSAALVRRAETIRTCRAAIAAYVRSEFGRRAATAPRPAMRHFHRLGFEVRADGRILAGVDLHLTEGAQSKDSDGLARSLLLARHLPLFVLAFGAGRPGGAGGGDVGSADAAAPASAASPVSEWAAATAALGMEWVGILTIDPEGGVDEARPALPNPEKPDGSVYAAAKAQLAVRARAGSEAGSAGDGEPPADDEVV